MDNHKLNPKKCPCPAVIRAELTRATTTAPTAASIDADYVHTLVLNSLYKLAEAPDSSTQSCDRKSDSSYLNAPILDTAASHSIARELNSLDKAKILKIPVRLA